MCAHDHVPRLDETDLPRLVVERLVDHVQLALRGVAHRVGFDGLVLKLPEHAVGIDAECKAPEGNRKRRISGVRAEKMPRRDFPIARLCMLSFELNE